MANTVAHLVDNVFPKVAVRQWVMAYPKWLRGYLAGDNNLLSAVLRRFIIAAIQKN